MAARPTGNSDAALLRHCFTCVYMCCHRLLLLLLSVLTMLHALTMVHELRLLHALTLLHVLTVLQ